MLVWPIAASAPMIIEQIDSTSISSCHCPSRCPNGIIMTDMNKAIAATLGAVPYKAVTEVGEP